MDLDNSGPATTAFELQFRFTRTGPEGELGGYSFDIPWLNSQDIGEDGFVLRFVKADGIVPSGITPFYLEVSTSVGYTADVTITAIPTPGSPAATTTIFDVTAPVGRGRSNSRATDLPPTMQQQVVTRS